MQDKFPRTVLSGTVTEIKRESVYPSGYSHPSVTLDFITIDFGTSPSGRIGTLKLEGHRPIGTPFALTLVEVDQEMQDKISAHIEQKEKS